MKENSTNLHGDLTPQANNGKRHYTDLTVAFLKKALSF
jgi:hypothetical protein